MDRHSDNTYEIGGHRKSKQFHRRLRESNEDEQPFDFRRMGHNASQQTQDTVDDSDSNDDTVRVDQKLLVAAIDIGTTYSGYAFSFAHEQTGNEADPDRIHVNTWENEGGSRTYFKTPSCLLLFPNGNLDCFGNEALEKYKNLEEDKKHREFYFFREFKMTLHQEEEIQGDSKIRDENGKEVESIKVFRYSIQYLKEHLTKVVQNCNPDIRPTDIRWVITVPAIWKDSAKKFMRQAAEQAVIDKDQIDIALEPESASLYCRSLKTVLTRQETSFSSSSLTNFPIGTKYMVLDCGGGTVDVTVHEVIKKNTLRELHAATGGDWGGTKVNKAFLNFVSKLVGPEKFNNFATHHKSDYLQLIEDFEMKKRNVKPDFKDMISIRIPSSLNRILAADEHALVQNKGNISLISDKLRIHGELFQSFFKTPVEDILNHAEALVKTVPGLQTILLVGGFAESPVLQQAVKDKFKDRIKVIVPIDPSLCVMKGAVLYGYNPSSIEYRRSRYTYGIATSMRFREGEHPPERKSTGAGEAFCDDIFDKHVEIDQELPTNMTGQERTYFPITNEDKLLHISLYRSTQKNPKFVDERGCKRVGTVEIPIDMSIGKTSRDRPIKVKMVFGMSDIRALATQKNGKTKEAIFRLN